MEKDAERGAAPGDADEQQPSGTRRRGEQLEQAILLAAWEEWRELGYVQFTMEGVAARAKTNKTAVYRRWPSKARLVIAAVSRHVPKPKLEVPNTGDLRQDVLALLHGIVKPMQAIGAETIHGILVDYHGKELLASLPQMMQQVKSENKLTSMMNRILEQAAGRGEVDLSRIPARVVSLPADLLKYEILTTHEPLTDDAIAEIVDEIFLPLVRI